MVARYSTHFIISLKYFFSTAHADRHSDIQTNRRTDGSTGQGWASRVMRPIGRQDNSVRKRIVLPAVILQDRKCEWPGVRCHYMIAIMRSDYRVDQTSKPITFVRIFAKY